MVEDVIDGMIEEMIEDDEDDEDDEGIASSLLEEDDNAEEEEDETEEEDDEDDDEEDDDEDDSSEEGKDNHLPSDAMAQQHPEAESTNTGLSLLMRAKGEKQQSATIAVKSEGFVV